MEAPRGNTDEEEQPIELQTYYAGSPLDSRMTQFDDVLNDKLESVFHKQTSQVSFDDIAKVANEYDPIDLAYAVTRLPPHARVVVYDNLPDLQAKIIFIINTGNSTRAAIFREVSDDEIVKLVERMPPDEAVRMLDDLSDRRLKRILDLLDPKKSQSIRDLQAHDRHSAGRLMTNEFFSFNLNTTIGEVAASIRHNPGVDLTRRIFVLDDEEQLIGYVPARNLIVNPHDLPLHKVMRPVLHSVIPDASHDEVVDIVMRYKEAALPVIDPQKGILLGVITQSDVIEVMEDMADKTIASFAGTAEDVSEREPTLKRFLGRAPWLLVTLCAGIVTSTAMQSLSTRVWFTALPFFVPLITGMSGNVGIQCSSVLVRGISIGEFSSRSIYEAIRKELIIGLVIASIFGFFCGLIVYFLNTIGLPHPGANAFGLSITVAAGVFCACLTAAFLGATLPFFFVRCRIDPAVASGPIVTAFNDVLSTLTFFLVSRITYIFFA